MFIESSRQIISGTGTLPDASGSSFRLSRKAVWTYYFVAVLIFYIWYQLTINLFRAGTIFTYDSLPDLLMGVSVNFSMILLLFLVNTFIVYGIKWRRNTVARIGIDFLLSLSAPLITNLIFLAISFLAGKTGRVDWLATYVINFMVWMINEVVFFVANYKRSQHLFEKARSETVQLEYNVLRARVNPHFLFNSLNILYSLSFIDIDKSREFTVSLSRMYRNIMGRRTATTVEVSTELDFLKSYIEVLETHFAGQFRVEITGAENAAGRHIVPFSLQLLVENVTKHNIIGPENPMTVSIDIRPDRMLVSNPIRLKRDISPVDKSSGVGLLYLTKLYGMHGGHFSYTDRGGVFAVEFSYIEPETSRQP